jgi:hypothetical protein
MHTITLVCSVHNANGKCNVEQLVKILRVLGPDVILQEVRPSDDWSLEAQACNRVSQVQVVPTGPY